MHAHFLHTCVGHVSCTGQCGGVGAACPLCGVQCLLSLQYVCASTAAIQAQPYLLTSAVHNTFSQELDQHILTSCVHMHSCIMLDIPICQN